MQQKIKMKNIGKRSGKESMGATVPVKLVINIGSRNYFFKQGA